MSRITAVAIAVSLCLVLSPAATAASDSWTRFAPGAPGIGDPYFPLDGNGGYDVKHYRLEVRYDPATDVLDGVASIRARATQNLSRFNLDLVGMNVRSIRVGGRRASWTRAGDELTVEPRRGLRKHRRFRVVVVYDGVPQTLADGSGFIHTDDGTVVIGQPDVASTWYPVNDHPLDKASYTFRITVPEGLEAVANGELKRTRTRGGRTTWTWVAREPMASYLTTATIGEFNLSSYRVDGIDYWDAIDPDLFVPVQPRSGDGYAISQAANLTYKRLARTISVPQEGGQLSFWVQRATEPDWDYLFVEAHAVGSDGWTTLPDLNGHTGPATGGSCPYWHELHPWLARYQTDNGDGTCSATGSSGTWSAASGSSDGYEQWTVDLSPYAGADVELSISYVSDDFSQGDGAYVDDIVVTGGEGSTSFEDDGDVTDGWTALGAPAGSAPNENDWIAGTADDAPNTGERIEAIFARQPEIIAFLEGIFGPYPFSSAGGIVDDHFGIGFALENQTRPIYAREWWEDPTDPGDGVVVHELAHQWVGDSLALSAWQEFWLNEGFASYSEWLWSEAEGFRTAQEIFDDLAAGIPADDPFWDVVIGDPGPDLLFHGAVYDRGAMTLHALRLAVGERDFFRILRLWAQSREGDNVTTDEFIALAERISGDQLDAFFATWLFTAEKPAGIEPAGEHARTAAAQKSAGRGILASRHGMKR